MVININKVLKDYQGIVNPQNKTVGSILKHHRKLKGMTLEEVAKGISSISYLCKVERNQINPSIKYLNLFAEKLKINLSDLNLETKDSSWIDEVLRDNYLSNKIFDELGNSNSYQSKLVILAKKILNDQDLLVSRRVLIDLSDYYASFDQNEMEFFIYLLMSYLYLDEKYRDVFKLFNKLRNLTLNPLIIMSSLKLTITSLSYLDRGLEINSLLEKYIPMYYQYNRFDDINYLKNIELITLAKSTNFETLDKELNLISKQEDINKDFILYIYYFNNDKNYEKALEHINEIKNLDERYYIYYLVTLIELNNIELLTKNLQNNLMDFKKTSHQKFYELMVKYYLNDESINQIKALNDIEVVIHDFIILSYIFKLLLEDANKRFVYKRSAEILTKSNYLLEEKTTIILKWWLLLR